MVTVIAQSADKKIRIASLDSEMQVGFNQF